MTLLYALHTILRGDESLAPGAVYEFDAKDRKQLLALEATRIPTEDEVGLYRLAHPPLEADDDAGEVVPEKPKGRSKKATVDPTPDPAVATDPDVAQSGDLV